MPWLLRHGRVPGGHAGQVGRRVRCSPMNTRYWWTLWDRWFDLSIIPQWTRVPGKADWSTCPEDHLVLIDKQVNYKLFPVNVPAPVEQATEPKVESENPRDRVFQLLTRLSFAVGQGLLRGRLHFTGQNRCFTQQVETSHNNLTVNKRKNVNDHFFSTTSTYLVTHRFCGTKCNLSCKSPGSTVETRMRHFFSI